jgi:hypothetical protein
MLLFIAFKTLTDGDRISKQGIIESLEKEEYNEFLHYQRPVAQLRRLEGLEHPPVQKWVVLWFVKNR